MARRRLVFCILPAVFIRRLHADRGIMSFPYEPAYLAGTDARAVSLSLPLRGGIYQENSGLLRCERES